jgi:hypothetical protein
MMQIAAAIHTFPPHGSLIYQSFSGIACSRTDERTGQAGPARNLSLGKALDAACLIGKAGRGVHDGQKRKLHHRPNTLPQTTSSHQDFLLAIGRRTIHCPKGVPMRPAPTTRNDSWKGTELVSGRSPRPEGAERIFGRRVRPKGGVSLAAH